MKIVAEMAIFRLSSHFNECDLIGILNQSINRSINQSVSQSVRNTVRPGTPVLINL